MRKSIKVYTEGDTRLREGFARLFQGVSNHLKGKGAVLQFVLCGSRVDTFHDFKTAIEKPKEETLYFLLVDSEGPLDRNMSPKKYLQEHPGDGWVFPRGVSDDQCLLMVQKMESWLCADIEAVHGYFDRKKTGKNNRFRKGKSDEITTGEIDAELGGLARSKSNSYKKIDHAVALLNRIDPQIVLRNSDSFKRAHDQLMKAIG